MANELIVKIVGDTKSVDRAFQRTQKHAKEFASNTNAAFAGVAHGATKSSSLLSRLSANGILAGAAGGAAFGAATVGTEALVESLKKGVELAAELQKSAEAVDSTFGHSAAGLHAFAKEAANIGISQAESEQFSARIGLLTRNLGIGQKKSAEMAQGLQELAGSLAEIRGIDPATVLASLPVALAGNIRTLKQLGFAFTAAEIKGEAVTLGLIRQHGALTSSAKAQAVYALVTRNLSDLQAQAAENSGDLVNQQHRLAAETANLETNLGELAAGPLAQLVTVLADATSEAVSLAGALDSLGNKKLNLPGGGGGSSIFGIIGSGIKQGVRGVGSTFGVTQLFDAEKIIKKAFAGKPAELKQLTNDALDIANLKAGLNLALVDLTKTPPGLNLTASQKNTFFDNALSRLIDRSQDLGIPSQIADLRRISHLIEARIAATKDVTRKLNLEDKVVGIARTIKGLQAQQVSALQQAAQDAQQAADEAKQKRQDAAQAFLDALSFGVTKAQATKGTNDDLQTLKALQAGIKKEIAAQGSTLELQQRLFDAQQQITDVVKQRQDAARAAVQARQFRGLGLSATGDAITPGIEALKRELAQVEKAVAGTKFDTKKNKGLFDRIFGELTDPNKWGKVTLDTRQHIQSLLDGVKQQLDGKQGALTKTTSLADRVGQAFGGLGLSRATEKQLAARLVGFNSAGRALAPSGFAAQGTIIVQHESKLDGRVLERSNTTYKQKRDRRNPPQRRGQQ